MRLFDHTPLLSAPARRVVALLAVAAMTASACSVSLGSLDEQTSTEADAATDAAAKPDLDTDDASEADPVNSDAGTADGESAAAPLESSASSAGAGTYDGPLPSWFRVPAGFTLESFDLQRTDIDSLVLDGTATSYANVCRDVVAQTVSAGIAVSSGSCSETSIIAGSDNQIVTVSSFGGDSISIVFIGFELVDSAGSSQTESAAPAATPEPEADADDSSAPSPSASSSDESAGSVPTWFDPPPGGAIQHEINTEGTYEIIVHSRLADDSDATFVRACNQFEADAQAAGWNRVSGDNCTDDVFAGATYTDPVSGFEAKIRQRGGNLALYFLEVGVELTAAEITAVAFDRDLGLLPSAFNLVPGDEVIALSEALDETPSGIESYTTSIEVSGPNTFADRCNGLVTMTSSDPVTGRCDDASEFAAVGFSYGGGTIVLSEGVYTFVIRNT